MLHRLLVLLLACLPAVAEAAGGGGVTFDARYLPRYGTRDSEHVAPGGVGCLGGMGYGTNARHLRVGGELSWCRGSQGDVQAVYGGAQIGHWFKSRWPYFSIYTSLGFGALTDKKVLAFQEDPYTAFFFYAKPTLAVGLPLGFFSAEFGLYFDLPVNLAQWVGDGYPRGFVTPSVGAQVALLFGSFKKPRREPPPREPVRTAPAYAWPAPPGPPPRPDGPPPDGPPPVASPDTIPEVPPGCDGPNPGPDCDERPLAVPEP